MHWRFRALSQNIGNFGPRRLCASHLQNGVGGIIDYAIVISQMRVNCEKKLAGRRDGRCSHGPEYYGEALADGFGGVTPYLAFWPLPNAGLDTTGDIGYYRYAANQIGDENFYTAKLDHHFSDRDSLNGSFLYDTANLSQPDPLDNLHFVNQDARTFASIEETHVFSASVINTARFGFSRNHAISTTADPIKSIASDTSYGSVPGRPAPFLIVPQWTFFYGGLGGFPNFTIGWNSFQGYDDATVIRGKHSFKLGVAFERMQSNNLMHFTQNGRFVYGSFSDFLTNNPLVYGVQLPSGETERGIRQSLIGVYAQDSWRAGKDLTFDYGVRYEITTVPTEVHGRLSTLRNMTDAQVHVGDPFFSNPTLKDFSPRIGFAWNPDGAGKTAVRGGFGIYDVLPLPYLYLISAAGSAPFTVDPTLVRPGAGTFPKAAYNQAVQLVAQSPLAGERVSYFDPNPPRSLAYNWNLNVQRQVTSSATLTIAYVGSRGAHLPYHTDDANIVLPTLTEQGYVWPSGDQYQAGTVLNPNVGDINRTSYDADSYYHSLQVGAEGHLKHGLEFRGSYTWGRSIDSGSSSIAGDQFSNSPSSVPLWFDAKTRRGLSDFNLSQNGVVSLLWETPEVHPESSVLHWVANGWQTGAIFEAASGSPFSVLIAGDPLGMNSTDPWDYPDRLHTAGCGSLVNPGNPNNYIKTQCFSAPVQTVQTSSGLQQQIFRLGNAGRNELVGPGLASLDFSLVKNSKIADSSRASVQFRAEAFNILNKSNFAAPLDNNTIFNQDGTPADGAGVVDQTQTTSRQIQFGLKILF